LKKGKELMAYYRHAIIDNADWAAVDNSRDEEHHTANSFARRVPAHPCGSTARLGCA
jgi:hypothetical protein